MSIKEITMGHRFIFGFIFILSLGLLISGCNRERRIVPFNVDTDQVLKAITPNDEGSPDNLTFGRDKIPGHIFDYECTTDNDDIYAYFQNLTVLNVNSKINQDLFDFIFRQMGEFGFINDSVSLPQDIYLKEQESGLSYSEVAVKLLDKVKTEFESQVSTLDSCHYPFNIYFQVYPVFLDNEYITYRQSAYAYTGGAHGMTISYLRTYDLTSGELMTFDKIVKPADQSIVREEVAAHMAYSYPIYENLETVNQYIDSLNVWLDNFNTEDEKTEITAENFPVSDVAIIGEGLVFIYQMYELTPGSDGCPMVVIPYDDIKGCLVNNIGI